MDLVGGYYDAGDHVKFGLPMAFTVTMLSWSVIEYAGEISDAGEMGHAVEAIKWGTDYFIKAHTSPNVLWAEVIFYLFIYLCVFRFNASLELFLELLDLFLRMYMFFFFFLEFCYNLVYTVNIETLIKRKIFHKNIIYFKK